ncbi:MAG: NAD-glutamate dehydrogenase [Rhodospirillaceae bacterium]
MESSITQTKADMIERLIQRTRARLDDRAPEAEAFLQAYFVNVPAEDLLEESDDALFGQALSFWSFGRDRMVGTPKIRVFNPTVEEHGWHSDHTVVEIVNDDMPFLVDSVTAELNRLGLSVYLVIHPVLVVARDGQGKIVRLASGEGVDPATPEEGDQFESYMHFQVREQTDPVVLEQATASLEAVLADVRAAVEDWQPMREECANIIQSFVAPPESADAEDIAQAREFLTWLRDDHFTFLGYRTYTFLAQFLPEEAVPEAGLGTLRDPATRAFGELRNLSSLPEEVGAFVGKKTALIITKSSERSRVHRPVAMDAIGVKMFSECGTEVVGLQLFIGLFTADVYTNSPNFVPVIKAKLVRVMRLSGLRKIGHDGKKLMNILENLPRDELFQTDEERLLEMALGILHLHERRRTALFLRQDEFQRFMSCLVFVPRDHFDTALRLDIQAILEHSFAGTMEAFNTQVTEAPLARVHFIIRTKPGHVPDYTVKEIELRITQAARNWTDSLRDALLSQEGEERGMRLHQQYEQAFPAGFRERFTPDMAVGDVKRSEKSLCDPAGFAMNLYRLVEDEEHLIRFKVYKPQRALPLSDVLPVLEHMGFRVLGEVPFKVKRRASTSQEPHTPVWVHDFSMEFMVGGKVHLSQVRQGFQDCFARVWAGDVEDDGFNRLVVSAGLSWRQVVILRAYAKYLRQAQFTFSQAYIEDALAVHSGVAQDLVALFETRLAPGLEGDREEAVAEIRAKITEALEAVDSADEDRILRRFLNLIDNTLRTNYWQTAEDGGPKSYVSFKLNSGGLDDLPKPRPWVEVFVYSPRVEAIHLRGGPVARGGIRWSDRREDFRTEILGLVKAQMVKNAVIVPVGSKGGFVVKRPPEDPSRQAQVAEGIECYKTLMRGLLDVTDNLNGAEILPPVDVLRTDGDDPYLVVAADKGTATFSDIANGVSEDYGFWLRDAFASGGSNGYDHKAMGITARGAWEAVKRHFREIGHDTQTQDFTVVGIGDMSGDVFGNGMLLSEHIRLVAAFNHMHIFIDPNPVAASSFKERKRLFELPRSTWEDYDQKLISKGGGIFKRAAKSLQLSPEIQALLDLPKAEATPNQVMRAILKARVDLLWFGGIGTYIRESGESDGQAGDRANDAIRITGRDVRAKVIGEGANLGVTQRGRIEYAQEGGRLNTDAIDNSAGVDCSDHEVNIKILLNGVVSAGDMTEKQRNTLLEDMTDEVAELVLRDNYLQTQAISMTEQQGGFLLDHQHRLMRVLERLDRLDRAIEFLPDDEQLLERQSRGQGLVRPEISVLIPYAKMWLYDEILASDIPDEPMLETELQRYFPKVLAERFPEAISAHRLRREIIATVVTNSMINRVGGSFLTQMTERTGMAIPNITRAYLVIRDAFQLRQVWEDIQALDAKIDASVQYDMMRSMNDLVSHGVAWLLRNEPQPMALASVIAPLKAAVDSLRGEYEALMPEEMAVLVHARQQDLEAHGVPEDLARQIASAAYLAAAPDIARLAKARSLSIEDSGRLYFAIGHDFGMEWLRDQAVDLIKGSHWNKLAVLAVIEDLFGLQREVSLVALDCLDKEVAAAEDAEAAEGLSDPIKAVMCWRGQNVAGVMRCEQMVSELKNASDLDLAMLTVAVRQFRTLLPA